MQDVNTKNIYDKIENLSESVERVDTKAHKEYVIEVDFKGARKGYFTNPKAVPLRVAEFVIVDFDNGEDMGDVSGIISNELKIKTLQIQGSIIRKSNHIDVSRLEENRRIEDQILIEARQQAKSFGLEMKFIDIEYKFDRKKLVFFFTADGRVDFRELVKTFASKYRTRIELRQIGVRDEAQKIGGVGVCGRELCCSKFLKNFVSINVSMARDQNLLVKPEKFSGVCGKLMCCLKFEHDFYLEQKRGIPEIGSVVKSKKGEAIISGIDVFKGTVTLSYRSGDEVVLEKEEFIEMQSGMSQKGGNKEISNAGSGKKGACDNCDSSKGCATEKKQLSPEKKIAPVAKDNKITQQNQQKKSEVLKSGNEKKRVKKEVQDPENRSDKQVKQPNWRKDERRKDYKKGRKDGQDANQRGERYKQQDRRKGSKPKKNIVKAESKDTKDKE